MKFLNIIVTNGAVSESVLKLNQAKATNVLAKDLNLHENENFLRKLQDGDGSAQDGDGSAQDGDVSEKKRIIFTCQDDAGCVDAPEQVGNKCVEGFCVNGEKCAGITYNNPDPNPEACWLWKFPNDTQGFYKRVTVTRDHSQNLDKACLFYRFHLCSDDEKTFKENPRNCEYKFKAYGECAHWETKVGGETKSIGYARNKAVESAPQENPKNKNGQTCWTAGSVPPPFDPDTGDMRITNKDMFWKNKDSDTKDCLGSNMLKDPPTGCGLVFEEEWQDCKRWSGFHDLFAADKLDSEGRIFAQIRGHTVADEMIGQMAETGEKCENFEAAKKNIVREIGQGVQECTPPAELCPKGKNDELGILADVDQGIHKEGCCLYKFGEWTECKDGKKTRGILELEKSWAMVPCFETEALKGTYDDAEANRSRIDGSLKAWQGIAWDDC